MFAHICNSVSLRGVGRWRQENLQKFTKQLAWYIQQQNDDDSDGDGDGDENDGSGDDVDDDDDDIDEGGGHDDNQSLS